jgi:hypothetical protein
VVEEGRCTKSCGSLPMRGGTHTHTPHDTFPHQANSRTAHQSPGYM